MLLMRLEQLGHRAYQNNTNRLGLLVMRTLSLLPLVLSALFVVMSDVNCDLILIGINSILYCTLDKGFEFN